MPAFNPPDSVSRTTMVMSGPGFRPSTTPSIVPAAANARTRSTSMLAHQHAAVTAHFNLENQVDEKGRRLHVLLVQQTDVFRS